MSFRNSGVNYYEKKTHISFVCFCRYLEVLLRRVSSGHIVYSPIHKAFVSLSSEGQLPFNAEEYADLMGK